MRVKLWNLSIYECAKTPNFPNTFNLFYRTEFKPITRFYKNSKTDYSVPVIKTDYSVFSKFENRLLGPEGTDSYRYSRSLISHWLASTDTTNHTRKIQSVFSKCSENEAAVKSNAACNQEDRQVH